MRVRYVTFVLLVSFVLPACSQRPSLQLVERPEWLERDGLVMAGSWEPLLFRVRRDGAPGYTPTEAQRAAYLREHGPEITQQLKDIGVNFIMMHCYKGAGRKAEAQSMAEAVRFARFYREQDLRVGVYNFSGAFIWELLFKETPQAKDWVLLDSRGKPRPYGRTTYRYYWNRNHPDAQAFYKEIIRFAIEEMGVDLLHFDNYSRGPGHDGEALSTALQGSRRGAAPRGSYGRARSARRENIGRRGRSRCPDAGCRSASRSGIRNPRGAGCRLRADRTRDFAASPPSVHRRRSSW